MVEEGHEVALGGLDARVGVAGDAPVALQGHAPHAQVGRLAHGIGHHGRLPRRRVHQDELPAPVALGLHRRDHLAQVGGVRAVARHHHRHERHLREDAAPLSRQVGRRDPMGRQPAPVVAVIGPRVAHVLPRRVLEALVGVASRPAEAGGHAPRRVVGHHQEEPLAGREREGVDEAVLATRIGAHLLLEGQQIGSERVPAAVDHLKLRTRRGAPPPRNLEAPHHALPRLDEAQDTQLVALVGEPLLAVAQLGAEPRAQPVVEARRPLGALVAHPQRRLASVR